MKTEAIVYLARKLHWSREEIGKLHPLQFIELYNELAYQESVDEYRRQCSVALILAAIANTIPRKRGSKTYQAKDFLKGNMPERQSKQQVSLEKMAEDKGIKLPLNKN